MNWKLFVAQRIYRSREGARQVSRPAVLIATWGIAVGLAVMIVAVAVVVGFKHEVRDKVVGLGADITITNFEARQKAYVLPLLNRRCRCSEPYYSRAVFALSFVR